METRTERAKDRLKRLLSVQRFTSNTSDNKRFKFTILNSHSLVKFFIII